jgi:protein TonB
MDFILNGIYRPEPCAGCILHQSPKTFQMNAEMILHSDLLDILFENRNKDYGAYELRTHYNRRLKKSMLILLSALLACIATFWGIGILYPESHNHPIWESHEVDISPISPPDHPLSPRPKPMQQQVPIKRTEIPFTSKPIITRELIFHPMPEQNEIDQKMFSNKTVEGLPSATNEAHSSASTGPSGSRGDDKGSEPETIFRTAEIMPEFPGGQPALSHFLASHLHVPQTDRGLEPGTTVQTMIRFVVNAEGVVQSIECIKSGGKEFDAEVRRVLDKMPRWKPGMQNGKRVSVYFLLPVSFTVSDEN